MDLRRILNPISNQDFIELTGGRRRPGRRGDIMMLPGLNRWRVRQVPLDEPSTHFTSSLEARFEGSWEIPIAPPQAPTLSDRIYQSFDPVLNSLVNAITTAMTNLNTVEFRVYLRHDDEGFEVLENPAARASRGTHFAFTNNGLAQMRRQLAQALATFIATYVRNDETFDRDLNLTRIRFDLAPRADGGGMLPKSFPLPIRAGIVWEPKGVGNCGFKCVTQALGMQDWSFVKQRLGLEDFCPYTDLMEEFVERYPTFSVRLLSVTGLLRFRVDGQQFEYAPMSPNEPAAFSRQRNVIYLILEERHYFLVLQVALFIRAVKKDHEVQFCHGCCKIFRNLQEWLDHCCVEPLACEKCKMIFANTIMRDNHSKSNVLEMEKGSCEFCGQNDFVSTQCQTNHLLYCPAAKAARNMAVQVRFRENHRYCGMCNGNSELNALHVCYMETNELPEGEKFDEWYAFDFESMLIHDPQTDSHKHFVNKVCVQQLYVRPFERWSFDGMTAFVQWLKSHCCARVDLNFAFLAHNLKGYDGRLTLAKLFNLQDTADAGLITDMIWVGAKIQTFKWGNINFRDSLLHVQQALASFPKIFGLQEMHKGFFPYKFNIPENQNYIGPIPHLKYFEPDMKSVSGRKELLEWYNDQQGTEYNFKQELEKYCISDVDILAQSMEKYNDAGKQLNHPQLPPLDRLTIASYTLNCWKTLHMPPGKIVNHTWQEEKRARDALRGGRTDVRCFYKNYSMEDVFVNGKYGKYVDVQSMYPYVMYSRDMPVGKPKTYDGPEATVEKILQSGLGFACITADPPSNYRHHTCAVHTDEKSKRLIGKLETWERKTFCLTEISDMIQEGWQVREVDWIQAYESDADLFKEYISKLVTEKIQASSGPPEDFDEMAMEWARRFNVRLERAKMVYNAGLRAIAKLQLNSLWGKLSERAKIEFFKNVDQEDFLEFEQLEASGFIRFSQKFRISKNSWFIAGERIKYRSWEKQLVENRKSTSVAIGAHVTMWGRRMLWEEMVKLGKRVLYHDTDSILYEYDSTQAHNTKTGKFLGDWEEELPGCAIIEFVGLAPKTYGYRWIDLTKPIPIPEDASIEWLQQHDPYKTWNGNLYKVQEAVKVKGFNLHYSARQVINFDGLVDLFRRRKRNLQATQLQFKYDRSEGVIISKNFKKDLIFDYEKGMQGLGDDPYSYPHGVDKYWRNGHVEEGGLIRVRDRRQLHDDDYISH